MRLLPVSFALFVALGTVARADEEDDAFIAQSKRSIGLGVVGHTSRIGDRTEGGWGPGLDLAIGRGRWQYFGEAGFATSSTSAGDMTIHGRMVRGGIGVRWLARQFRGEAKIGGVEMYLLSLLGAQRYYLADGTRLSRPEIAAGAGLQARFFKRPALAFRADVRLVFTPTGDDSALEACRGRCMSNAGADPGFMLVTGFAW